MPTRPSRRVQHPLLRSWSACALAVAVVLGGLGLTAALSTRLAMTEVEGRLRGDLAERAGAIGASIERYGSLVAGAAAYWSQTPHDPASVTDEDLRRYLGAVGGQDRFAQLEGGLTYIARVDRAEVEQFTATRRADLPSFAVADGPYRVFLAVVSAQSSALGHHGLRLDADPERSTTLAEVVERGDVLLTGPVTMPGTDIPAVHVFAPVTEVGSGRPLGWVGTVIAIEGLVRPADGARPWALTIMDNGVPVVGTDPEVGIRLRQPLDVLGRTWVLTASTASVPLDVPTLIAGGALTALLAALSVRAVRSRQRLLGDVDDVRRDRDRYAHFVQAVLADVSVGIVACDATGQVTVANDAAMDMVGTSDVDGPWDADLVVAPLLRALAGEHLEAQEVPVPHDDGDRVLLVSARPLREGEDEAAPVVGAVVALHDITERTASEAEMRRLALQDHLTGLANRRRLSAELQHALLQRSAGGTDITLLFMDLDRFKQVNDTAGHHRGDRMLIEVADRLRQVVHPDDVAARVGGDEFVLLCTHCASADDAHDMAARVLGAISPALQVEEADLGAGISIGVVRPTEDASVDDVLRFADLAMYEAKSRPGQSIHVYEPELGVRAAGQQALESGLRRAVREGGLSVAYQPIIDLGSGAMTGVEALVRWAHADGVRSPAEFLPLAEETGLIVDIDLWMLGEACRAAVLPDTPPRINVNLSARTLALPDLAARVESALAAAGATPGQLCLELTETALIGASQATDRALAHLAGIGVGMALDDFGTGYATLDHLRRFPVDTVKIDRSFVRHMTGSAEDREIISGTVHLARRLGLTTVAEGVETPAQSALLDEMGCDRIQGYLVGRPMSLEEIRSAGRRGNAVPA